MTRQFFVGGNFKMNGSEKAITTIVDNLNKADLPKNVEVVLCPPYPYLAQVVAQNKQSTVKVGAQNCYCKASGAYTGEVSPDFLKDLGVDFVILGHSERRTIFHESDELVADKVKFALEKGLKVMLCIGETIDEKKAGKTLSVCQRELKAVVQKVKDWSNIVVAYEPIWAIGTGLTAKAEDAEEIHADIRKYLSTVIGKQAESVRILYGGSANGSNAPTFKGKTNVDGFLVGGASLKPEFADIIKSRQ
ncbi:triosephosphate isomerase [Brettanomyces nanus]|uniref:Triosephosphate isomerase n=1 Tax=Eeniella nana TaxID=13502 RepID=A0A875S0M3_EENNA|nr:triosephosphate isomerase [Brettanomyces nanus]QPG73419.1 triosephosphate isomerase [Brettanomyces nanus]